MSMTNDANEMEYSAHYSADKNREAERIRSKYVRKEDSPLEQLRDLDRKVERPGFVAALVIGIVGCLIMGGGMSMVMVIGGSLMVPGIILGVIGLAMMGAAYPVFRRITAKRRDENAAEIGALADKLN